MGFYYTDAAKTRRKKIVQRAQTPTRSKRTIDIVPLFQEAKTCAQCTLDEEEKNLEHPKMPPTGSKDPAIYILGEAPGKQEDEVGKQFVGAAGALLRKYLPGDLSMFRWSNTVRCRPPGNRTPTQHEMECCSGLNIADIEKTKPLAVLGFGHVPLSSFNWNPGKLESWRGERIPMRIGKHVCWYFPMYHPSYIARMERNPKVGSSLVGIFKHDIDRALEFVSDGYEQPWVPDKEEQLAGVYTHGEFGAGKILWGATGLEKVRKGFKRLWEIEEPCIDLETTCLRPYTNDSRILTVSIGNWDYNFSFCLDHRESQWKSHEREEILAMLRAFILRKGLKLWAHNAKFEMEWLFWLFEQDLDILFYPRWQDTMAQASVLNERRKKELDDCCFAMMGVLPKAIIGDTLDRKALDREPLWRVAKYCAYDTKYTWKLAELQHRRLVDTAQNKQYKTWVRRLQSLAWMQSKGWHIDPRMCKKFANQLAKEREEVTEKIAHNRDVREYEKICGEKFSPTSTKQVPEFFRDFLKAPEGWSGKGEDRKYGVDESVLERIKHPVAGYIVAYRKVTKLEGTYVLPCSPGGKHVYADGKLHPNFNQFIAETTRLSSDEPNGQNFPKRGGKKYIRNMICAPEGHLMVAIDFGQIEARVIAMFSEDKHLCDALWNEYDIHMDWAKRISHSYMNILDQYEKEADGDDEKMMKLFRADVKNQWTFPAFFGSPAEAIASAMSVPLHIAQRLFKEFWSEFPGVKRWQEHMVAFYEDHQYVELLTGRRRNGPLTREQIINNPVQGTAAEIDLERMDSLAYHAYEHNKPQLQPVMNVHDDLTFYFKKNRLEKDIEEAATFMCKSPFRFINVPITVEVSVGTHWGELDEVAVFSSNKI